VGRLTVELVGITGNSQKCDKIGEHYRQLMQKRDKIALQVISRKMTGSIHQGDHP
jgi:hypothetical protein